MNYGLKYSCEDFLSRSELPWVKYALSSSADDKKEMLGNTFIKETVNECLQWPDMPLLRHNDAKHIIHKICILLDLGMTYEDAEMKTIANKILSNQSDDGALLTMLNIAKNFGGNGENELGWIVCDFPILLYILLKLGLENDERTQKAIGLLKAISSEVGWQCVGAIEKFRGPGRKTDYCPYGTLVSLKAFSMLEQYHQDDFIIGGIDSILSHWKNQKERKIYMFGIGTDFRKLKYPNVWFDIVHVVRVLGCFEHARKSKEFGEMISIIADKQLNTGGFIPESIYTAYKQYDFGQKKKESETLTYMIYTIFKNLEKYDI
ncbi:MAG: hypothetical protein AB1Z23_02045 [Eubacteriales bacterium]